MSIADFNAGLSNVQTQIDKTNVKLDEIHQKVMNLKGPLDEIAAKAQEVGSAVGEVGGVVVEAVRLSGEAVPMLEGVAWKMYEIQKDIERTEGVSRDILDRIKLKVDEMAPNWKLWLDHFLQQAADGEMGIDKLRATIEEFLGSAGIQQINAAAYGNDIQGFLLALRRIIEETNSAADSIDKAADRIAEAENRTSGVTGGSSNTGGVGASTGGAGSSGSSMTGGSSVAGALVAEIRRIVR